jgi:hypothetical protein
MIIIFFEEFRLLGCYVVWLLSEECSASIIRVTGIGELGTKVAETITQRTLLRNTEIPILVTLMMETPRSSETSVLTRSARHNMPEDALLHSHRRENLKSYLYAFCSHDYISKAQAATASCSLCCS